MFVLLFISPILGIAAFINIFVNRGSQKGYIIAVLGILMFIPALRGPGIAWVRLRQEASIRICQQRMKNIGEAICTYSKNHGNQYPDPNKWCDLIKEHFDMNNMPFECPAGHIKHCTPPRSHYAINPNAMPYSANDLVLLFETECGWNQSGGPELANLHNHSGFGFNVLFNNGRVEFVKKGQIGKLKWKDKQKTTSEPLVE
jgi:hypothetical protein